MAFVEIHVLRESGMFNPNTMVWENIIINTEGIAMIRDARLVGPKGPMSEMTVRGHTHFVVGIPREVASMIEWKIINRKNNSWG